MKIDDLPAKVFMPGLNIQNKGFSPMQFRDENDKNVCCAWGTLEKADEWLKKSGVDLWKEKNETIEDVEKGISGVFIVIQTMTLERLSPMLLSGASLHYEPDIGHLFSPPERIVTLKPCF